MGISTSILLLILLDIHFDMFLIIILYPPNFSIYSIHFCHSSSYLFIYFCFFVSHFACEANIRNADSIYWKNKRTSLNPDELHKAGGVQAAAKPKVKFNLRTSEDPEHEGCYLSLGHNQSLEDCGFNMTAKTFFIIHGWTVSPGERALQLYTDLVSFVLVN